MWKCVLFILTCISFSSAVLCEDPACPTKPGVYALNTSHWSEVPRESVPNNNYSPGFIVANVTKELAGEKAFVSVTNPLKFCVSGARTTATFSLEKAKVKRGTRQFVQSGNFHAGKENQSQGLASLSDESGSIHLLVNDLKPGQYVIWMHGTFDEPLTPSGSSDPSTRAYANALAAVQAMSAGNQGFLFAFGVE